MPKRKPRPRFHSVFLVCTLFVAAAAGSYGFAWLFNPPIGLVQPIDLVGYAVPWPVLASESSSTDLPVHLIAVGDIMLSRSVADTISRHHDPNYPFLKTSAVTRTGDIVFGNLETPITAGRHIEPNEMVFRSNPGVELALKDAGFNVLSLANNHVSNFGMTGILDTVRLLDAAGVKHAGAGQDVSAALEPAMMSVNGTTFAFLAFDGVGTAPAGVAAADIGRMTVAVEAARQRADVVVVSIHSGIEYAATPSPSQVAFSHAAIEAGADLVIGHHPHVIQPVEQYRGKLILYSLGNFIFDQMWSPDTTEGMLVELTFKGAAITDVAYRPIVIANYSQPYFAVGSVADRILARLQLPQ